ncbi:pantoate--beta-alanine ligase [Desulfogranum japonicum]|uniref:pantoate--beta-alanine ligase n=1 Tax=Desulfogranum japonicum TaxID=231447 RepID=UPI000400562A|nr:pantoate--beta-alanine ligase [Desulfogranum japonicum]
MKIIETPREMYDWSRKMIGQGKVIGLVPTMGFFHEGHLSLMRTAKQHSDKVVTSLFVNPIQFGPNEDLDHYPRDLAGDVAKAEAAGVDILFTPNSERMYPGDNLTEVSVHSLTENLCGAHRPGHFAGVTTVVTKLFNIVQPELAVFGEKDFQQLAVIRQMVKDLNIPVRIIGHPIVREQDGLAMSSRNANLLPEHRKAALSLSSGLNLARQLYAQGVRSTAALKQQVQEHVLAQKETRIDYISFVHCDTLQDVTEADAQTVLALAVHIGDKVRLIDNGRLELSN